MSYQAVSWAYDAPTLLTKAGKPDTTAHAVLVALAETAEADGTGARPSVLRLHYRTRFDPATVRRALDRLEAAAYIRATGVDRFGVVCWDLDMSRVRPANEWDDLVAERDAQRLAESAARAARRDREKAKASGTESAGHIEGDVATGDLVRDAECRTPGRKVPASGTQTPGVRDATPPEPSVTHPSTVTTSIPGGTLPPDPLRTEPPTASRTDSESHSPTNHGPDSLPSDHPLGDHAPEPPAPPAPADLATRPRCPHGRSTRTDGRGVPRCPDCRTERAEVERAQAEAAAIAAVGAELAPARCTPHRLPIASCTFCRRGMK